MSSLCYLKPPLVFSQPHPSQGAGYILDAPKPPQNFIDFVKRMSGGVYDVNPTVVPTGKVQGVEEANIIKTDGSTVYTIVDRKFFVEKAFNDGAGNMFSGSLRLSTYPDDMRISKAFFVIVGR